jgi:hypothetical protein
MTTSGRSTSRHTHDRQWRLNHAIPVRELPRAEPRALPIARIGKECRLAKFQRRIHDGVGVPADRRGDRDRERFNRSHIESLLRGMSGEHGLND